MRLSSHKRSETKLELAPTSMIDVVFLLLIFFITTTTFVRTERDLDSAIQVDRRAPSAAQRDLQPTIIEIVREGDAFLWQLGGRRFAALEELTAVLRLIENKWDGAFVRVRDDAPFHMAAGAIQAAKDAGFAIVSYVPETR